MRGADRQNSSSLLRKLLACFSIEWILSLLALYRSLRQMLPPRHQGLYEILAYDCTLDLLDPKGTKAILTKRQRVQFLQNDVIAFQDIVYGDGDTFARYAITPGVEVDRYREGDRWHVLISLRETKHRGDGEDFYIQRTIEKGFQQDEEWLQVELRHRTNRLTLSVIFPAKRRCRRAVLVQRSRHRAHVLGPEHFVERPDGRQMVCWEAKEIEPLEVFTLKWQW